MSARIHHEENHFCKTINEEVHLIGTALAHSTSRTASGEIDKVFFDGPEVCTGLEKCGRKISECEKLK